MEKQLKLLFDYQRFRQNPHLSELIENTDRKYRHELSDDDLELVNAAGETIPSITDDTPKPEVSENA